jgi:hypothetical protein
MFQRIKITQQKLFRALIAAALLPVDLRENKKSPEIIIRADDPDTENLEVYNVDTGETLEHVTVVSLGRWAMVVEWSNICPIFVVQNKILGNWQVRQKIKTVAKLQAKMRFRHQPACC